MQPLSQISMLVGPHTRKCIHPELTSKVNSIIHQCWKVVESTKLGKVKISVDSVFSRLDELHQQKVIRLSELTLAGKIRAVYQSIGRKPQVPRAAGCKHGRMQGSDVHVPNSRQKKARVFPNNLTLQRHLISRQPIGRVWGSHPL